MTGNGEDEINWPHVLNQMRDAEARSRGYATYWEWPLDRRIEESDVARTLASFLSFTEGSMWASIELVADDPPDVLLIRADGRRIGVEVTELVSGEAAKRHRHRKKTGEGSPYDWTHWTADEIAKAIGNIVETKDQKLTGKAASYDHLILAIATDEPMISLKLGQEAVRSCRTHALALDRAFLLMSYHPDADKSRYPDGCPVLPILLEREV